ncbi:MAG: type I methionyl aminopeptidase [Clostridia bacterium]|nr:type I methionyl aminopeptidase [Clostridia bacterium]MBR2449649.1 type I methionyl aminopeptidase [Clostridia bacterium]
MITIKTDAEIALMRESGRLTKEVLDLIGSKIRVGMTTKDLDKIAYEYITSCGAYPSFLGYSGYPASICASVDDMVVHGIPSEEQVIKDGQIVSIDVGVEYNGWQGDAARTFMVGNVSEEKKKLVNVTKECFFKAIENLKDGTPLGDIGYAVQTHAEANGFSVVRALVGHGIGTEMHEDPNVPNYGKKGTGIRLKKGMVIAIEPMINAGVYQVDFMADGWGVRTRDRKPSAHYENTVAITENGVEILTL